MEKSARAERLSEYFRRQPKLSEAQAEAAIEALRARGEAPIAMPRLLPVRRAGSVFYANESSGAGLAVFYIHGGGYAQDFSPLHWKFIRQLVARTDARIIAPSYKLIPSGTCADAFALIAPLYAAYAVAHPEEKIALMGDSSGGGLALALAEHFSRAGIRGPDELILISPWVDVSMDNPEIADCAARDPWLSVPWLKVCGRHWAGDCDVRDWRVSPIYGDLSGLTNVTVFTGTEEVLYPDIMKLCGMFGPGDVECVVGAGMNHVYPLLPVPEAEGPMDRICEILLRQADQRQAPGKLR